MKKLIKIIIVKTTLELVTGLHIGGNGDGVEIGGIDNPVIKLAFRNNEPFIPGSSLRGKIRCLLEQVRGADLEEDSVVNALFGSKKQSSRLIVRDALLTTDSEKALRNCRNLDMPYTENKYENQIDRRDAKANPRQNERVPAGAVFNVEFVINIWEGDSEKKENEQLALLEEGISLLEADYLGGSGSRGYGQVKFGKRKKVELSEATQWKKDEYFEAIQSKV